MDCYQAYRQRFDMEHTLRFSKQRLLMNSFQTPDVEHEENWIQLTQLAYIQLWAARNLVSAFPRPKRKRYPVIKKGKKMKKNPSPTQTAA